MTPRKIFSKNQLEWLDLDPVAAAQISFETSKRATTMLCESILTRNAVNLDLYENDFQTVHVTKRDEKNKK